jgi:FkbM family methyltransferase
MPVVLPFVVDTPGVLEYRVESFGTQFFGVKYERRIFFPGNPDIQGSHSRFCVNYEEEIRRLLLTGAKVSSHFDDGVILEWRAIKLLIENPEDFVLINEILTNSSYNFFLPGNVCVVDVGMNVGISSLYMATKAAVSVIYGFEPFSRPFARALKNFSLNPALSAKIRPCQVGLGGANEVIEVPILENETIGTSLRGRNNGTITDRITISEASEALRPVITEALDQKQAVVIKLDCEGSEFTILQSLQDHSLVREVDAFMIECHKNWVPGKDNETIGKILSDNGFYFFDFNHLDTTGSNIYAFRPTMSK